MKNISLRTAIQDGLQEVDVEAIVDEWKEGGEPMFSVDLSSVSIPGKIVNKRYVPGFNLINTLAEEDFNHVLQVVTAHYLDD